MKNEIRNSPRFIFNWSFQAKTVNELQRRSDYLIELFQREIDESKPKGRKKVNVPKAKPKVIAKNRPRPNSRVSPSKPNQSENLSDLRSDFDSESKSKSKPISEASSRITRPTRNRKVINYKES